MKKLILWTTGCFLAVCLGVFLAGCTNIPKPKLLETDNPPGYKCKTHGAIERVYKVGVKYYCKQCVDENIGQVEMVLEAKGADEDRD